ncbi:MAG: hypothetical protein U5L00_18985 [Desulfovermiculus sp.]|nr:hypothetical protein [Desulfovermiculus sp.]
MTQAGVSERAELLEINGHSVQGRDLHEVAAMLHGEPESLVQLRLRPLSADSAKTVDVVRSSFRPLDVELIHAPGSHCSGSGNSWPGRPGLRSRPA